MTDTRQVKIRFRLDPSVELKVKTEDLWAEPHGQGGGFRLLSSPFFVFGVSLQDVVSAEMSEGILHFGAVLSRGGHSTYRIFLQDGRTIYDPLFRSYWKPISDLGATFENANGRFVSVDIPPQRPIDRIYELMEKGEQAGIWQFEEVNFSPNK